MKINEIIIVMIKREIIHHGKHFNHVSGWYFRFNYIQLWEWYGLQIYYLDHLNLNRLVEHMQPYNLQWTESSTWENYGPNAHSTEYIQEAFTGTSILFTVSILYLWPILHGYDNERSSMPKHNTTLQPLCILPRVHTIDCVVSREKSDSPVSITG